MSVTEAPEAEVVTVSLELWENHRPTPMELKQEDIDEIHALITTVGEKCQALGTSFAFTMVGKVNGLGQSMLQSRMGVTMDTMTPEIWAMMFLQRGGLDMLLDNMEVLVETSNDRHEKLSKLSLILPSTSIILP